MKKACPKLHTAVDAGAGSEDRCCKHLELYDLYCIVLLTLFLRRRTSSGCRRRNTELCVGARFLGEVRWTFCCGALLQVASQTVPHNFFKRACTCLAVGVSAK